MSFNKEKLIHLIVINKRRQKILISAKFKQLEQKNPESLAISYNPFEDQSGALTAIPMDEFTILIEGGGWPPISNKNAVLLFLQGESDDFQDEPYRERLRRVHSLTEKGKLDSNTADSIKDNISTQDTNWLDILILQNFLSSWDLEWVGLLDINPYELLIGLWAIPTSPEMEMQIRDIVFRELTTQIERGGTTIGLDVERMREYEDLSKQVERVLDLRTTEISNLSPLVITTVHKDDEYDISEVDLEPLLYTAYGNEVLSELNLRSSCSEEDFLDIEEEFGNLGLMITTTTENQDAHQPTISMSMQHYIRYIHQIDVSALSLYHEGVLNDLIRAILR